LFTPSANGTHKASLTITDNASGSPHSVSLSGMGLHDVILTWTPSTTPGIAGYNIFRSTTSREGATPLNSSPISGTTYADTTVQASQKYWYWVTAISSNGITQSPDSPEASATVPSP
jgi:fibronectin type 3 domain-containing protein